MKTNLGLVEYCKAQLGKPYWWGTFGHRATESLLRQKSAQYPNYYKDNDFKDQYGQKVHDCSGLIKGYFFCDTVDAPYNPAKYDSKIDGGISLKNCKEKGTMETIPDIPGVLVFLPGHVGVYVGNGKVIEARGHDYGVVETNLVGRGWQNWGKLDFIEYNNILDDFKEGEELKALDYLAEKGRISDKEKWQKALDVVKDFDWILIKWANDVLKL